MHRRDLAIGFLLFAAVEVFCTASEPKADGTRWSLQPVNRPTIPSVQDKGWPASPIDHFILAKLESRQLWPSAPADRPTLIRRATFDLHGLPPTPAEVDAFCADGSSEAFARVIDRLLASPRYGERWARHWLDVVRFAESHGFEFDRLRENAWRYRDYVIESLNKDKPYDHFVQEQIAGDALIPQRSEGIIATGFLVAGPWDEAGYTSASALLKERIREEELEDMIAAVSQTFLAFTVNCARCHDHKFDPVPQKDYYRLKAALQGVRHGERSALAADQMKEREERSAALQAEIADLEKRLGALELGGRRMALARREHKSKTANTTPPLACWTFEADAADSVGGINANLHGDARIANGRLKLDGRTAFAQSERLGRTLRAKTLEAWITLANLTQRGGSPLSVEGRETFDAIVFGEQEAKKWMAGSAFFRRTRSLEAAPEKASNAELIHVAISYDASNRITFYRNGVPHGKSYVPDGENAGPQAFPGAETHLLFGLRHTGSNNGYLAGEIEEARIYNGALTAAEIRASFEAGPVTITDEQIDSALSAAEQRARTGLRNRLADAQAALHALPKIPRVYGSNPTNAGPTHVLARGDVEKKREVVGVGGLSAVTTLSPDFDLPADAPEGRRRVRLAEWITDPRNPLTARVMVNRIWHYHFGRGLASLPNDFGLNGGIPSHPELLDWLAAEFVERGWSIKHLHRVILLSSTYRQTSTAEGNIARLASISDADNLLLWKFPIRRLEAEVLRDTLLIISGNLNPIIGGPSYRPFTVTVSGSNFYEPVDEAEPALYRRTIYRMAVHSGKNALLDSLDCPDPSTKTPARANTTTPIQSLGLMNNPFVMRQVGAFTERLRHEAGNDIPSQVQLGYRLAFGRCPTETEATRAASVAAEHGLEHVAWTLVNASEFVYIR